MENKIQVWATTDNGNGYVANLGVYKDITEFNIRIGTFSDDVLITFENYIEDEEE